MKFAAIDIGSNALRLLLVQVLENGGGPVFKKDALFRFPLRLGEDAFVQGRIGREKENKLLQVMTAYSQLIKAYEPVAFRGCATASMREAKNAGEIIERIRGASGLNIEVIDGKTEAAMIYANHVECSLRKRDSHLYIDVGGGSTQLTVFSRGRCVGSRSFDIGAVRLLQGKVRENAWETMKQWVKKNTPSGCRRSGIGSGGNINKAFILAEKKPGKALSRKRLKGIHERLLDLPVMERVRQFGLRPDRADVIVPALQIFLAVMKWGRIEELYVPFIGVADGIVHMLHASLSQTLEAGSARKA